MAYSLGKKLLTETGSEKEHMVFLLDKYFKINVLKMLKEYNKDVKKVKKMIYDQNGNIIKEKT